MFLSMIMQTIKRISLFIVCVNTYAKLCNLEQLHAPIHNGSIAIFAIPSNYAISFQNTIMSQMLNNNVQFYRCYFYWLDAMLIFIMHIQQL